MVCDEHTLRLPTNHAGPRGRPCRGAQHPCSVLDLTLAAHFRQHRRAHPRSATEVHDCKHGYKPSVPLREITQPDVLWVQTQDIQSDQVYVVHLIQMRRNLNETNRLSHFTSGSGSSSKEGFQNPRGPTQHLLRMGPASLGYLTEERVALLET